MRILVAGGGTGGHIYPALAIAAAVRRREPAAEFLFVGTSHGMEADLVPRAGYPLKTIHLYGFQRRLSLRNVGNLFWTLKSLWDVRKILREFRPDAAVGTGGYVCGPVIWAAARAGVPTLIQEQNAFPGVTNRILGRVADAVALGYAEAGPAFAGRRAKVEVTGNPVRQDLLTADRTAAYRQFGFSPTARTLLVMGGSQGARSINRAALDLHRNLAGRKDIQILHITGKTDYNDIIHSLASGGLPDNDRAAGRLVVPYLHEMPAALAMADLAVSRAGAIGLAELTLRGVPSILVPYPFASENHQEINARALERRDAAIVVRDAELTGAVLGDLVGKLILDGERLRKMAAAAASMGHPHAAETIADMVLALTDRVRP